MDGLARVRFIAHFMKVHLAYHGGVDFPLDVFIVIWRKSALMSSVFEPLSKLLISLIRQRHALFVPLSKTISSHLIELTGHKSPQIRAMSRHVAIEWFTGDKCNGIITHHQFGTFVQREIKQLEAEKQPDQMGLVATVIGAFGPFLGEMTLVEATSALLRMLKGSIDQFNPSLKSGLIDLASSLIKCQHHLAPMALCQMHVLVNAHFNSRHMDQTNRRPCRQLLDTIERLQRPFNTPTQLHQREMTAPAAPQQVVVVEQVAKVDDKDTIEDRIMSRVNEKIESILGRLDQKKAISENHAEPETTTTTTQSEISDDEEETSNGQESEEIEEESEEEDVVLPAKRKRIEEVKEFKEDFPEKNEQALENIMALFEG